MLGGASVQADVAGRRDAAAQVLGLRGLRAHTPPLRFNNTRRTEPAAAADAHIARTGAQGAVVAHAHAGLGANEGDLAGVHAAQLAHVQCQHRCLTTTRRGTGQHLALVNGHGVVAGDQRQVFGMNPSVDLDGSRQDAGVVGISRIKPSAVNADGAALHAEGVQTAIVELRHTGGEGGAAGVDEASTVHVDASGVGDDDFGALPRHLDEALELAGVGAVDFIEDDACLAASQPRVALHPAPELGLCVLAAVVEHSALGVDVKLLVGVAAHASGAGRLDVDQRRTVGRGEHRGPLPGWRARVGDDLRLHQGAGQHTQAHSQRSSGLHCASSALGHGGARPFATTRDGFCHCHDAAARRVEDKPMVVLVHEEIRGSSKARLLQHTDAFSS